MRIQIGDNDHELKIGVKFIKQLDQKHTVSKSGVAFGIGVLYLTENLRNYNPLAASEALVYAANITEEKAEAYVESLSMTELKVFIDSFLHLLTTAPLTALQVARGEANKLAAAQAQAK